MKVSTIICLVLILHSTPIVVSNLIDSFPIISQVKSLVQVIAGDQQGAKQTQENFSRGCPVVSQVRSAVEAIQGDNKAADETLDYFLRGVSDFADGIPGVGHIKGVIHYAVGDKEAGDQALKSASRTVGVIGGAMIGTATAGPFGTVAGGMAGGAAVDGITTGVESAIHQQYRPNGIVASVTNMVNGQATVGDVFDTVVGVAMDGGLLHVAGKIKGPLKKLFKHAEKQTEGHTIHENIAHKSIDHMENIKEKFQNEKSSIYENIDHIENILEKNAQDSVNVQLAVDFESQSIPSSSSPTHWLQWEDNAIHEFFTHAETPMVIDGVHITLHSPNLGLHHILYGGENNIRAGHLSQFSNLNLGITGPVQLFTFLENIMEPTHENYIGKFYKITQTPDKHVYVFRIPESTTNYLAVVLSESRRFKALGLNVQEIITVFLPSKDYFQKKYVPV